MKDWLVCPLFSETRRKPEECGGGPVEMERFFGVFCKTRKTMSGDRFAILSSLIHPTALIESASCGAGEVLDAGIWWRAKWTQSLILWSLSYGSTSSQRVESRGGPCSLFYDTHPSGKIQPFWFLLHRLLWRGYTQYKDIYEFSLSLSG